MLDNSKSTLKVDKLSYVRVEKKILSDISLNIPSGKFIGLLGPNGAGKSTLLKVMAGFLEPNDGAVLLDDINLKRRKERDIAKKIAYMPQTTHIDFAFTVEQIVLMGRHPHVKRWKKETSDDYKIAETAMQFTGIIHLKERYVNTLSGGERQLVFLARAITQQTPFLLLDEPTSDLDIHHQVQICQLILHLKKEGKTIIAVIHDLNLAARYCDEIVLMKEGRVIANGDVEHIFISEQLEFAYQTNTYIFREPFMNKLQLIPYINKTKEMEIYHAY